MHIAITKMLEAGYNESMFGLSLNKNQPIENMPEVAERIAKMGNGHGKFLEDIQTWWSIQAPRYFWQEAKTYRLSTQQSESTMHTILKRPLMTNDFEDEDITEQTLSELNMIIKSGDLVRIKRKMPEGFLQARTWRLSYANMANVILQRKNHKLPHWKVFVETILKLVDHPELLLWCVEK